MLRLRGSILASVWLLALGAVRVALADDTADLAALVAQEDALNVAYQNARQSTSGQEQKRLVDEQRKWLRARNLECGLSSTEAADSQWPLNLSGPKANCVTRTSRARAQALAKREKALEDSLTAFSDNAQLVPTGEYTVPMGHSTGKWYAEVTIARDIAEHAQQYGFQAGVDNVNGFYAINFGQSPLPMEQKIEVVGLAVDLDGRYLRWRTANLSWTDSEVPLAMNEKPYAIKVKAVQQLEYWLSRGQVRINYGQTAFQYPMPAGYAPWHYVHDKEDPVRWLVPAYERVAGKDVKQTAEAFWQWLLDRDATKNPTIDRDGTLCGLNQKGPLWFLAGAQAVDRVERTCQVAYGANIVLPVIASMLAVDDAESCKATVEWARLSPYTIQDSFIEIDGKRFDRLQDYSASAYVCAPLHVAGKQLAKHANWLGLWVTLRPLPRGEHTIVFGARVKAMQQDRRVTYKIRVQ